MWLFEAQKAHIYVAFSRVSLGWEPEDVEKLSAKRCKKCLREWDFSHRFGVKNAHLCGFFEGQKRCQDTLQNWGCRFLAQAWPPTCTLFLRTLGSRHVVKPNETPPLWVVYFLLLSQGLLRQTHS